MTALCQSETSRPVCGWKETCQNIIIIESTSSRSTSRAERWRRLVGYQITGAVRGAPVLHFIPSSTCARFDFFFFFFKARACRAMICTLLSSAHWQQASKLSALRRFESIWKDWDKCAYQYNNNNNLWKALRWPCAAVLIRLSAVS